jgi:methanogenic corrinoid protein MtbC1
VVEAFLRKQHMEAASHTTESPAINRWVIPLLESEGLEMDAFLLDARARTGAWYEVSEQIAEAFTEIGRRWAARQVTIAQEHHASEQLQRGLARILGMMPSWPDAPTCLLACVQGDEHDLGLSLAEVCLREVGWAVHWIGRNTPTEEIVRTVASGTIDMAALSASVACRDESLLGGIAKRVAEACATDGKKLLLGGRGAWPSILPPGTQQIRSFAELHETAHRILKELRRERP